MRTIHGIAAVSILLLAACENAEPGAMDASASDDGDGRDRDGGAAPVDSGAPADDLDSLFPLATGNSWTFRVTDGAAVSMKTQTVGSREPVGGTGPNEDVIAFRMETEKAGGNDRTVSWQEEVDGKLVRYREQSFMASTGMLELEEHWDPYKIRLDMTAEHLTEGAEWVEAYRETKLPVGLTPTTTNSTERWRVVAVDEAVEVPAGAFQALVVEKISGAATKRYWFVRGVGKVKETGTQTEELTDYEIVEE